MKEFKIDFENTIAEVNNYGGFVEYVLECSKLQNDTRTLISEKLLHYTPEYEGQTFNLSLIIPLHNNYPIIDSAYLWASEILGVSDDMSDDIISYIRGECDFDNMMRVTLMPSEKVQLLSELSESVDMRAG